MSAGCWSSTTPKTPRRQPAYAHPWQEEETEGEFGVRMNRLPKFVASRSLQAPLEWHGTLLEGDPAVAVAELKRQPGQDVLIYGSGALVSTLLPHQLIDEFRLMIFPVVLGTGTRLFRDRSDQTTLKLID
jgi:dihydrofolate reductase